LVQSLTRRYNHELVVSRRNLRSDMTKRCLPLILDQKLVLVFVRVMFSNVLAAKKNSSARHRFPTTIQPTYDTTKMAKTYNSGYSLVVTHLTTNPPVHCLSTAERTGSSIFSVLWSYVNEMAEHMRYIRLFGKLRPAGVKVISHASRVLAVLRMRAGS
jgi:hypothetical protein